jgi:GDP-L-fucose synthase
MGNNSKKTLVTGARGLVGSFVEAHVRIGSDWDLRLKHHADLMFLTHQPQHVIHCAARVGGLGGNMKRKGEFFYDNIMMNTNIIEGCRHHNVEKLVCFLSTCIFPANVEYPLTERKIHLGPPHSSNDAYAYAKRMADVQIRAYREQYGLNYVSVIPTNIYGINDNFELENGHVIPMLIHKCYLAKKNQTDFMIWGSGEPLREFIYNQDVAKLTQWVLENYDDPEPIILSNSVEISIKEVVKMIAHEMEFDGKIIFDSTRPDGQFKKPSDNSKLKSYLPDFQFTPLEQGIKETVAWFVENYETVRR